MPSFFYSQFSFLNGPKYLTLARQYFLNSGIPSFISQSLAMTQGLSVQNCSVLNIGLTIRFNKDLIFHIKLLQ